jgi:hypothetical protein
MRKLAALFPLLLSSSLVVGQTMTATASLPKVDKDGFYRIMLDPKIAVYLNDRFSNIRIYDGDGQEVPYILKSEQEPPVALFQNHVIVDRTTVADSTTSLTLSNPGRTMIENITLVIKNAEVAKNATLSGSDDREHWYVLKEHFVLRNLDSRVGSSAIAIVDFPLTDYQFYLLTIDDRRNDPLNILQAGYYYFEKENAQYFAVPSEKLVQRDSAKLRQSVVRLSFDTLRFVDKLEWVVTGTPFYLRRAALYRESQDTTRKGDVRKYLEHLSDFQITSAGVNELLLPGIKAKDLVMVVENDDNPPLKIAMVKAYQQSRHLTAWMKKGDGYQIVIADAKLGEPVYDLSFFRDSIPAQLPLLKVGEIVPVRTLRVSVPATFFKNRNIIWGAIIFIVVLLGFMSIRLVRETNAMRKQ